MPKLLPISSLIKAAKGRGDTVVNVDGEHIHLTFNLRTLINLNEFQCCTCGGHGTHVEHYDGSWRVMCLGGDGNRSYLTIDHISPQSKGGKSNLGNLQTMCAFCNRVKGCIPDEQFKQELGLPLYNCGGLRGKIKNTYKPPFKIKNKKLHVRLDQAYNIAHKVIKRERASFTGITPTFLYNCLKLGFVGVSLPFDPIHLEPILARCERVR
jgi:hypothetical protein